MQYYVISNGYSRKIYDTPSWDAHKLSYMKGKSVDYRKQNNKNINKGRLRSRLFPSIKPGDLILVTWVDILQQAGWLTDDEAQDLQCVTCKSIGWLVNQDKNAIRVTNMVSSDGDKSCTTIPMGCVKKIKRIKYQRK